MQGRFIVFGDDEYFINQLKISVLRKIDDEVTMKTNFFLTYLAGFKKKH